MVAEAPLARLGGGDGRSRAYRLLFALAIAVLVLGDAAALLLAHQFGGSSVLRTLPSSAGKVATAASANGVTVVATLDNRIQLVRDGRVVRSRQLSGTVNAIAAHDGFYYAGTTLGAVYQLSASLGTVHAAHLPDAVVGMTTTTGGQVLVAHGSGAFSADYTVTRYTADLAKPSGADAVFTVTALDSLDNTAVYGTINSKVADIGQDGKTSWTAVVPAPVTTLLAVPARGWILVGDQKGGLTLLDRTGHDLGHVQVSKVALTAVGYEPDTGYIVTGDQRGNVDVLDSAGHSRYTADITDQPIRSIAAQPDGTIELVPQSGAWQELDPGQVSHAGLRQRALPWWAAANGAVLAFAAVTLYGSVSSRRRKAAATGRRALAGYLGYLFVLPAIIGVVVFTYYPAATAIYYAFTDFSLRAPAQWVGIGNFVEILFHDAYFRIGLLNMLIITVASFIKAITIPLLAAELVYWLKNHVSAYVFRTLFVLSSVVPGLVLTLLWKHVYDPQGGALNELLQAVGLEHLTRAWLGDDKTALWAVIGVGFPYLAAFPFLILLGGLLSINRDLYDSAAIDGATRWQQFRHIDLAHLRPQLRILAFFSITGAVEGFAGIFLLTQGGPGSATYVPALEMYLRISGGDLGYASALGVVLFVIILLTTIFILRYRRQESEI